jgi:hypothetical protein
MVEAIIYIIFCVLTEFRGSRRRIGFFGTFLTRLRHKLLKASNDAAVKRLDDGRFCWKSAHKLGLRLVCDAVVLIALITTPLVALPVLLLIGPSRRVEWHRRA